jgi:hypothetical protein
MSGSSAGSMQVPDGNALDRGAYVVARFVRGGAFQRVDAKQIVHLVPAGTDFLCQVRLSQGGNQPACLLDADGGQCCHRSNAESGPGVQREQAKEACLLLGQRAV